MAGEANTSILCGATPEEHLTLRNSNQGVQNMKFTINNAITLIIKHFKPNPAYTKQDKMIVGNLMPCMPPDCRPRAAFSRIANT